MKEKETAAEETVIKLEHICKSYYIGTQEVPVLTDIQLTINKGSFISIMGPSGAGKSTLMNILGCLDRPTKGSYQLDGEEVATLDDARLAFTRNQKIGFVFQSFNLLPRLSALDNVILPMIYGNVYKNERKQRAQRMLEAVGLGDRIHHMPAEMSGGQRQRVAIARALINSPSVLLADEPTGNLDPVTAEGIMQLFQEIAGRGCAVVMSTHNTALIENYPARAILFAQGHIREVDLKAELG